jgi:hypothetical protein
MKRKTTAVEWLQEKLATATQEELVLNINNWFIVSKAIEKEQMKEMYLKGIANYDPTFKIK